MIEFTSIGQMLRDTEQAGLPLWENVLLSDCERQGISREESLALLRGFFRGLRKKGDS